MPSTEIDGSFSDHTKVAEAANNILITWLHAQNDRAEAYSKMGNALVKVKLNLIASEVLEFLPKQK